jgi:hypothetical protein
MKKNSSLKKIIGLLVLAVILLFGGIFLLFQNVKDQTENASKIQNDISSTESQNQYVMSLQESLKNSNPDITKIDNSILSTDQDVTFIESFETLAKNNGLSIVINSLSVGDIPNVTSNNLTSLEIRASAKGSWIGTISFLSKLEAMPFIMRVEKFDLANSSDNPIGQPLPKNSTQIWQSIFDIRVLQYK